MKIGVMGTGNVGATLGRRWMERGHDVVFGTRDPGHAKLDTLRASLARPLVALPWRDAAAQSEIILLAVPWSCVPEFVADTGEHLAGRVLIDCINPLNDTFDGLTLGFTTSASEEIARLVPKTRVVKAFNTVSAATMADPHYGDARATAFYCGDDPVAKQTVHQLSEELEFEPVDAGPLSNARLLEPLAMLYIHLAVNGWGSNCAFHIMKRSPPTARATPND